MHADLTSQATLMSQLASQFRSVEGRRRVKCARAKMTSNVLKDWNALDLNRALDQSLSPGVGKVN